LPSLPQIDFFYIDREWLKAYPSFCFAMRCNETYREMYRFAKVSGIFNQWTNKAFTMYRTLDCIKRAYKRGYELDKITLDVCKEIRKRGKPEYYDFVFTGEGFDILAEDMVYHYRLNQILSLRFAVFEYPENDKIIKEKSIYVEYEPWLRIAIRPHSYGFRCHLIRVFYNPLLRAKYELGIKTDSYIAEHDNFIDPYSLDSDLFSKFLELNHKYAFDFNFIRKFIEDKWIEWFGSGVDLRISLTQLELCHDTRIPKMDLLTSVSFVSGRSKTIKYGVDEHDKFYYWTESGLKYYITTKKKGLQVKIYTKAYTENVILNRVEFTMPIKMDISIVRPSDVFQNKALVKVYNTMQIGLMDNDKVERVKRELRPLIHCSERCEDHYEFMLEMLVEGQMKGSRRFRHIAEIYKELGLIRIEGRGRYSLYVFNPYKMDMINVIKSRIESIVGKFINIEELLKATTPSPQKQKQKSKPKL